MPPREASLANGSGRTCAEAVRLTVALVAALTLAPFSPAIAAEPEPSKPPGIASEPEPSEMPELAGKAHDILQQQCHRCHGADGQAENDVYVLDLARLKRMNLVVPGLLESPLWKQVEQGAVADHRANDDSTRARARPERAGMRNQKREGGTADARPRARLLRRA